MLTSQRAQPQQSPPQRSDTHALQRRYERLMQESVRGRETAECTSCGMHMDRAVRLESEVVRLRARLEQSEQDKADLERELVDVYVMIFYLFILT